MVSVYSTLEDEEEALLKYRLLEKQDKEVPSREIGALGKGSPPKRVLGLIGEKAFARAFKLETSTFYDFISPKGDVGEVKVASFPRREEGIYLKFYSYEVRKLQKSKKKIFVLLWCPLDTHKEYLKLLLEGKRPPFSPIEFEVVGLIKKEDVLKEIERDPYSLKGGDLWINENKLTKVKDEEELLNLLDD